MSARERVLVVDDDESIVKLFENAFKSDYDVLTAADGSAGKRALEQDDDIALPRSVGALCSLEKPRPRRGPTARTRACADLHE